MENAHSMLKKYLDATVKMGRRIAKHAVKFVQRMQSWRNGQAGLARKDSPALAPYPHKVMLISHA